MNKPRPHRFVPALRRVQRGDHRLRTLAMEQLCQTMPTGAVALDGCGAVLFCNREAEDLLSRWSPGRAFKKVHGRVPPMPPEIVVACEQLRVGGGRPGQRLIRPNFGGRILVRHGSHPNLTAVVALDRSPRDRRFALFLIFLQDALRDSVGAGRKDQLALLTLAERRVAKLVAEGLRNSEIAATLGKSVMTVKSQLGTIFSKLSVRSRTQLVAVLRSSDAR